MSLDVYDVRGTAATRELLSSTPVGVLGHESGFAPDGRTFYVLLDLGADADRRRPHRPAAPGPIWTTGVDYHGMRVSADGNRLYVAEIGTPGPGDLVQRRPRRSST